MFSFGVRLNILKCIEHALFGAIAVKFHAWSIVDS